MIHVPYHSFDRKIAESSIQGYAAWAAQHVERGWEPYLLSFMFQQVPGSRASVLKQMQRDVERVYSTSLTRIVRKPRYEAEKGRLPIWLAVPDLPVPKRQKLSLRDVTVNDGLHYQGVALIPPGSRLKDGLDVHFRHHQALYVRPEHRLTRIHVKPVSHDPDYVTKYVLKSLSRQRFSLDEVLVLPRSRSELPTGF
jgi:hypothetical protein